MSKATDSIPGENGYSGLVPLALGNRRLLICFDWAAQAAVKAAFADIPLERLIGGHYTAVLAQLVAIAARREHGDAITPELVLRESPPLVPVVKALERALLLAFYGPAGVPGARDGNAWEDEERENPPKRRATRSLRRWLGRFGRASGPTTSGV